MMSENLESLKFSKQIVDLIYLLAFRPVVAADRSIYSGVSGISPDICSLCEEN